VEKPELCFPEIEKAFKYFDEFRSIKYNSEFQLFVEMKTNVEELKSEVENLKSINHHMNINP
jgi:hypothetical protein